MYFNLNIIMFSIILFLLLVNWLELPTKELFISKIIENDISEETDSVIPEDIDEKENPPSALKLIAKATNNYIHLLWLPPEEGFKTLKHYVIILKEKGKKPKLIFPNKSNCRLCRYEINNLPKNKEYKISILAINKYGTSTNSNIIKIKTTIPNVKIPKKLKRKETIMVSCNKDSTFREDTTCMPEIILEPIMNNTQHNQLIKILRENEKKFNFDIDLI